MFHKGWDHIASNGTFQMLTLAQAEDVERARNELKALFEVDGHEVHARSLSDPSGSGRPRDLLWLPIIGLWGYFGAQAEGNSARWNCWFGTDMGNSNQKLTASIEINLPVDPQNRFFGGRTLTGLNQRLYLGHKGYLGGGRSGIMPMLEFRKKIRGFVAETIQLPRGHEEKIFVIGAIDAPDFLTRLRAYVVECERLRIVARKGANSNGVGRKTSQTDHSPSFSPEADADGTGIGFPTGQKTIKRVHGRVVNALWETLGKNGINSSAHDMKPDLYLTDKSGHMHTLFEVKVSSDTQSWFTALGQLVVYGAGEASPPKRVLVCSAERKDPNFQKALLDLGVHLVTFEINGKNITFSDLSQFQS